MSSGILFYCDGIAYRDYGKIQRGGMLNESALEGNRRGDSDGYGFTQPDSEYFRGFAGGKRKGTADRGEYV